MKHPIVLLIIIFFSCSIEDNFNPNDIEVSFILTDTSGVIKNEFRSDEEFLVTFKIINNSNSDLKYSSGYPITSFSVLQNDSILSTSSDYIDYLAVIVNGEIKVNESYKANWIGPNSEGRKQSKNLVILGPGKYKITVNHNAFFIEYKLPETEEIEFEIIE